MTKKSSTLTDVLKEIEAEAIREQVSIGELIDSLRDRGFGVLIFIFSFIIFLPTGFIPGLAAICAICVVLITLQMLAGRHTIWIPDRFKNIELGNETVMYGINKLMPVAKWVDKLTKPRFTILLSAAFTHTASVICLLFAIATIPLSFIPAVGTIMSLPILLFSLGFMIRDGLLMLMGLVVTITAIVGTVVMLNSI